MREKRNLTELRLVSGEIAHLFSNTEKFIEMNSLLFSLSNVSDMPNSFFITRKKEFSRWLWNIFPFAVADKYNYSIIKRKKKSWRPRQFLKRFSLQLTNHFAMIVLSLYIFIFFPWLVYIFPTFLFFRNLHLPLLLLSQSCRDFRPCFLCCGCWFESWRKFRWSLD